MTCVYKHYDTDGRLLYIGSTRKFPSRTMEHEAASRWYRLVAQIKIEKFESMSDALARERELIELKKPPFNIAHIRKKMVAIGSGVRNKPEIVGGLKAYLESASAMEALEFVELAGISTEMAVAVLKGLTVDYSSALVRIESVLKYLKRKAKK